MLSDSPQVDGMKPVQTPRPSPEVQAETETQQEHSLLKWEAPEFNVYSHSWVYYLLTALAFFAVVGYSIYSKDWFIIIVAIVLAGFFYWYPLIKPQAASYTITQLGIYINDRIYPYSEIHSYWLFINQKENKLNIIFNKKYLPQLSMLLLDIDPLTVRGILSKYVPEQEGRTESVVDKFIRLLKL
jgi:hypothetical protein